MSATFLHTLMMWNLSSLLSLYSAYRIWIFILFLRSIIVSDNDQSVSCAFPHIYVANLTSLRFIQPPVIVSKSTSKIVVLPKCDTGNASQYKPMNITTQIAAYTNILVRQPNHRTVTVPILKFYLLLLKTEISIHVDTTLKPPSMELMNIII